MLGSTWELRDGLALTLSIPRSSVSSSEKASVAAVLLIREVFEVFGALLLTLELFDAFGSFTLILELLEALGLAATLLAVLRLDTRELFEDFVTDISGRVSSAELSPASATSSPVAAFFLVF